MAAGDLYLFHEFLEDEGLKIHNLESDSIKCALIKSAANGGADPSESDADPRWGAGGSTDYSTSEVTAGGNYSAGGTDVAATYSESAGTATLDGATNPSWAQDGSNPTNARWGIIYNDTSTGKEAIGYVDLGSDIDMSAGALTITWAAGGIAQKTETAGT